MRLAAAAVPLLALVPAAVAYGADLPRMDGQKQVTCLRDGEGRAWRVQCDDTTHTCLYAPDSELDEDGAWVRPLERTQSCLAVGLFDRKELEGRGYKLERAVPDAPYGWMRDERGRVFQVNFDLHRRLYVGGGWTPSSEPGGVTQGGSFGVDFGLLVFDYLTGPGNSTRHRVRVVEGWTRLAPFSGEVVLGHWDISHRYQNPLLRITTFFGKPRRSDLMLNLGAWVEAGDLEIHHSPTGNETLWRFATAQATLDLWQSRDLDSIIRLRTGLGLERTYPGARGADDRPAITPSAAVEADLTMDKKGFHHLTAEGVYESPVYYDGLTIVGTRARRLRGEVAYEVIILAINDQPLSLRIATGASRRDDIPGVPNDWAFTATAGLRFSLWAPARMHY